jgi:hypothetical protein
VAIAGSTSLGQNVEQEAPDEFAGRQRHRAKPLPAVAAVILVAEGYAALVEADQAAVWDGNAVGVSGEIGEHRFGPGEGWLGIDEPVLLLEWRKVRGEGLAAMQAVEVAKEHQPARRVRIGEPGPGAQRSTARSGSPNAPTFWGRGILAEPISGTAVLEYGATEILPPVGAILK